MVNKYKLIVFIGYYVDVSIVSNSVKLYQTAYLDIDHRKITWAHNSRSSNCPLDQRC